MKSLDFARIRLIWLKMQNSIWVGCIVREGSEGGEGESEGAGSRVWRGAWNTHGGGRDTSSLSLEKIVKKKTLVGGERVWRWRSLKEVTNGNWRLLYPMHKSYECRSEVKFLAGAGGEFHLTQIGRESENHAAWRRGERLPIPNLRCDNYLHIFENLQCGRGVGVSERQILPQGGISHFLVSELFFSGLEDKMAAFWGYCVCVWGKGMPAWSLF